jgi:hypothetical protein
MMGTPSSNESAALSDNLRPILASNGRKTSSLAGDRIAQVDPDVCARIEGNQPSSSFRSRSASCFQRYAKEPLMN